MSPEAETDELPLLPEHCQTTPEGVALALALSQLGFLQLAIQTASTLKLYETTQFVPVEILATLALTVWAGTIVTGALYEHHVLTTTGLSANPFTSMINLTSSDPLRAIVFGNILGQTVSFVNPVDLGFLLHSFTTNNHNLLLTNILARSVTGCLFFGGLNYLLQHGQARALLDKISHLRVETIKGVQQYLAKYRPLG